MSSTRHLRAYERELAPIWHDGFATLLWRHLPRDLDGLVLDVHSGSGRTTFGLLERLPASCRIIGLEPDSALRERAKSGIERSLRDRVYFKPGALTDVADMADESYALVVANVVLGEATDLRGALRGLLRVTAPGGRLMVTLPMRGTWAQAEDLLSEVLLDLGHETARRNLERLGHTRPRGADLALLAAKLKLPSEAFFVEHERSELLFRSGRELLFSAVVEHGPLRLWKALLPDLQMRQELFWRFKETIDTYRSGRPFAVDIVRGILVIEKPRAEQPSKLAPTYWQQYPTLDALWSQASEFGPEPEEPLGLVQGVEGLTQAAAQGEGDEAELDALLDRLFPASDVMTTANGPHRTTKDPDPT